MKIVVCIKQVPDPNSPGQLDPTTFRLQREGVDAVLDPGDECGVEAGLRLAEANGGEVTVVSMGPLRALDAIRKALAMGAAKGVLITDPLLEGADALTTAKVLAAAITREGFSVVVTGTESTDGYSGVVASAIAALLDVPALTFAKSVESDGVLVTIERQTETGFDRVAAPCPVVVSVTSGANEPRYPSLKGIMGAKNKPVEQLTCADLGLQDLGAQAGQKVVAVDAATARKAGDIVTDDGTAAKRIVEFLENAKVV